MGNYLNPGNEKFRRMIQSEIYVDKTGMIKYTNSVLDTAQNYVCVSRPRRFGKSMAANTAVDVIVAVPGTPTVPTDTTNVIRIRNAYCAIP